MSIRLCRECGHQVSTEAAACPKCGVSEPGRNLQQGEKISPEARAKAATNIGCIVVVIGFTLLALLVILLLVGYAIFGDDEDVPSTTALAQMSVAFNGAPSVSTIRPKLDAALLGTGTPITEENYSRAGSTLVALRRKNATDEMEILDCMVEAVKGRGPRLTFPDAAGLCSTLLAS